MSEQPIMQARRGNMTASCSRWCMVVLSLTCLVLAACAPATDYGDTQNITIVGFRAGSTSQMRADGIAEACRREHPDWGITSLAAGGSARIIETRISNEADFFFTWGHRHLELLVQEPLHPEIDFEAASDYRLVLPLYDTHIHMPTREETGLREPADIVERQYPFRLGCTSSTTITLFEKILEYYGSSLDEAIDWGATYETVAVPSPAGVEALRSGRIDLGLTFCGTPNANFTGYTGDLILLSIDDPGLVDMLSEWGFAPGTIPAGAYPFTHSDVPTMTTKSSLSTRPDMADDVVYDVLEAMFNYPDVSMLSQSATAQAVTPDSIRTAISLAERSGEAYHPGALRFFDDRGWLE